VLSALHVSQARELSRLREWAGRAPEQSARTAEPSSRRFPALAIAGLLVLGAVAAYGVTQATGRGENPTPKRHRPAVEPGHVTVAVLNGTTVPGLAARLRERIAAAGFKKGTIDDFSDKQLAESVVQYAPGHQAEAKAVSRTVGVSRREPATAGARALAADATVIVIAGADKAPYR
jgi:LytR cell envelope-related transcriptional attenuator